MERRKGNEKNMPSSAEEQGEIGLSGWWSPSDFFICLWFSLSSVPYCITLEGGKNPLPSQFSRSWLLQAEGGWAPFFFFPVVLQGLGFRLGYNNHRCPVSSPCPQNIVKPALSPCAFGATGVDKPPCFAPL